MVSTRTLARIAGALYLIVGVGGGFAEYVRTSVTVPGDAAATAGNIAQHSTLFKIGFAADLVDFACFLVVGLLLYTILKPVNGPVALAMVVINAVSVAMQALNSLNQLGALLLATGPGYPSGLALLFMNLHQQGYLIAQIYFGGYLLPLGYLVYRSRLFPKALGVILAIGGGGYLAGIGVTYLGSAAIGTYLGILGGLAEVAFLVWLLLRGTRTEPTTSFKGELAWKA